LIVAAHGDDRTAETIAPPVGKFPQRDQRIGNLDRPPAGERFDAMFRHHAGGAAHQRFAGGVGLCPAAVGVRRGGYRPVNVAGLYVPRIGDDAFDRRHVAVARRHVGQPQETADDVDEIAHGEIGQVCGAGGSGGVHEGFGTAGESFLGNRFGSGIVELPD
jgi:hypothetical protein